MQKSAVKRIFILRNRKRMNYNKIEEILSARKIKLEEFFGLIGMTSSGYYTMLRNQTMKVKTLETIARTLNVSPTVFWDEEDKKVQGDSTAKDTENQLLRDLLKCREEKEALLKENFDLKKPVGYNFANQPSPELNEPKT